jgi:hypothetical protein
LDIVEEHNILQNAVPHTKSLHAEAKKQFAAEETGNGKAFGQPINAKMEFGDTVEGNGACILMETCVDIIDKMEEHVLQAPTRVSGTDHEIRDVLVKCTNIYSFLLTASSVAFGQKGST